MAQQAYPYTFHLTSDDPARLVTDATLAIEQIVADVPPIVGLQLVDFVRRRCDASESRILADRYEKGASDRDVTKMAGRNQGTSKAEAKKKARRAKAANANPGIADKIADGTLSTEQADIIADAAEDTDGQAACDAQLISDIASTTPEQGKQKARSYRNKHHNGDETQRRYDRQRRSRGAYRTRLKNGNDAITIHGATEDIDQLERHIHTASDIEYQADGGRSIANTKHPRNRDQRNFDACTKLIQGGLNPDSPKNANSRSGSKTRRAATVYVTASVDQLTGVDTSPITGLDGKPLPHTYIEELAQDATFIAQLFSTNGELLWQGRQTRLATPAQIRGLISRDKGCVQCGAHPDKCIAHHLLPWEAPRKGPTNINNLALLCQTCHRDLHTAKQTMFYDLKTQTWKIRDAYTNEIPPDGGPKPNKPPPGKYTTKNRRHAETPDQRQRTKPHPHEQQHQPSLTPRGED